MKKKIIPPDVKSEVLAKVKAGERVMVVASQYGISDKTVYTWLRQDTTEPVVSLVQYNKLKRENEELKKLIGELSLSISLGKKKRTG